MPKLSRVAVCGGTHGNELSGVYLVRERLKTRKKVEEDELVSVMTVMSNPRAVQQGRRYTETDLNRCFTHATLWYGGTASMTTVTVGVLILRMVLI